MGPNGGRIIISKGPNGGRIPVRTCDKGNTEFLELNSKKRVCHSHKVPGPAQGTSFLQTEKRCLNRDETEITPQPLDPREKGHCFIQLKKTNLKTAKKTWGDFRNVNEGCDADEEDYYDGIEDNDCAWDIQG